MDGGFYSDLGKKTEPDLFYGPNGERYRQTVLEGALADPADYIDQFLILRTLKRITMRIDMLLNAASKESTPRKERVELCLLFLDETARAFT